MTIRKLSPAEQFHILPGFLITEISTDPAIPTPGIRLAGYQTLNTPSTPRSAPRRLSEKIGLTRAPRPVSYAASIFLTPEQASTQIPPAIYSDLRTHGMLPAPSVHSLPATTAAQQHLRTGPSGYGAHRAR
jgi:hypothetical protein